jgi:hypothetical protein
VSLAFNSLEGAETARQSLTLAAHSSARVDIDAVPKAPHRFSAVGSISILTDGDQAALNGEVEIVSRAETGEVSLKETLQPVNAYPGGFHLALVPGSLSVPVLAIHSLSNLSQPISIVCSDSAGLSFESGLLLPGNETLLVNACIRGRSASRTYAQLLTGDVGPMRPGTTIKVIALDPQGAISIWGFAATNAESLSGPRLTPVEFAEWSSGIEFLLGNSGVYGEARN